jgi:hypothetical protein
MFAGFFNLGIGELLILGILGLILVAGVAALLYFLLRGGGRGRDGGD